MEIESFGGRVRGQQDAAAIVELPLNRAALGCRQPAVEHADSVSGDRQPFDQPRESVAILGEDQG